MKTMLLALYLTLLAQAGPLPGTRLMPSMPDPASAMVDGVHAWLDARIATAAERRAQVAPDRELLRELIGAVDPRVPFDEIRRHGGTVRWPVLPGLDAEGFAYGPEIASCLVIALGTVGDEKCFVLAPLLIDRAARHSGSDRLKKPAREPHREFIHRMGFEVGRHLIGLEVQKVLAAVDWWTRRSTGPIRVAGSGDGALIALFACALDQRIQSCSTVNFNADLDNLANNPLDLNIWRFSEHFDRQRLTRMIRRHEDLNRAVLGVREPPGIDEMRRRQFDQMVDYLQRVVREADVRRAAWFAQWTPEQARERFWQDFIGKFPSALEPWQDRVETRPRYDEPGFTGYEVKIPVAGAVFAYGHLLIPRDLKPGERRPLVVAQHGLEGRPEDTILKEKTRVVYDEFAAKLARQGYVVYAPQNLYIHGDRFRQVQRKANPLGLSLFSFIVAQHAQHLNWLETLPFVDRERIAFYGLSYGGRAAMMVPPVEPRYRVVICSGNFNEWLWKNTTVDQPFSYMFTREWEMPDWNLGHTFNHFEMAALIAPRPFMVERGHDDGVGIDEWVAYEYAKVRRHYVKLGIGERTEIEYFTGPHRIWGQGTFAFLRRHLPVNPKKSTE